MAVEFASQSSHIGLKLLSHSVVGWVRKRMKNVPLSSKNHQADTGWALTNKSAPAHPPAHPPALQRQRVVWL